MTAASLRKAGVRAVAWLAGEIGTELAGALTAYAHDALELADVHATVDPANEASLAVLVRLGYVALPDIDEDGEPTRHLVHRA